jgi:EF-P beta-lysylation protein EpmB
MPLLPKTSHDALAVPSGLPAEREENAGKTPVWQKEMQEAFRTLEPLLRFLELDPGAPRHSLSPAPRGEKPLESRESPADPAFPILVPKSFAARMAKGDWNDPLLLQVLPQARENAAAAGFHPDAVGDLPSQVVPGLLHKYASRALLMVSHQCAVHCRYCFRREFPYGDLPRGQAGWDQAWEYLEHADGVDEIVLSGGDPLFLDNRRLERILDRARGIPRIRTIRFHTRLPIVLPSRVEPGLLALLSSAAAEKSIIVVVHANHGNEIDAACGRALDALRGAGAMLLNQAVLLAGINDDADVLADLSRALLRHGTLPYYLHQLDRVTGTAHFETGESRGRELIERMREMLPGYAVPRYVRETAGEPYKTPLTA